MFLAQANHAVNTGAIFAEHAPILREHGLAPIPMRGKTPLVSGFNKWRGPPSRIRSTFRYAAEEVAAGRPGSETVLAKLSELLFVEAVRRYAEFLPDHQTGWLAGLRDPYVGRALALLHRDITRRWTVDDLGHEVGLSRSALADRFIRLIGMPPMQYLAHWRMQVATQRLLNTNASLAQVAESVGYDSEAAFSRAFRRPSVWRQRRGDARAPRARPGFEINSKRSSPPYAATLGFVRRSGDAVSKLDWAGDGAERLEAFAGAKDRHIAIVEHAPED